MAAVKVQYGKLLHVLWCDIFIYFLLYVDIIHLYIGTKTRK